MQKRKELNLGYSDFKSIILENNYYIDKSLLIRDVIKGEKSVVLIPRPRRFGKTLNISMLRYFFDIKEPENHKLFNLLKIWQTEEEVKSKCGKYPVIYLSFKDVKGKNWDSIYEKIRSLIEKAFLEHFNLLDSDIFLPYEKNLFKNIINKNCNQSEIENSLVLLSDILYRYYQQKVVILIDEYDSPIVSAYPEFYEDAVSFMRNLMSGAFKDNKYLYKGVITGILRVSKESIFSGLNNIIVHSILDDAMSDKFGFTEDETKQILIDFEVDTEYDLVKKWYDGYKIGNSTHIYNPWSILNYALSFKEGFKTYWVNTSSDDLVKNRINERNADETKTDILNLLKGETINKYLFPNFVYNEMKKDNELIWTLLTFSGYLTVVKNITSNFYELKIPNYEIGFVFKDIILNWLNDDVKVKRNLLYETSNFLVTNKLKDFEKGFKKIMGDTFSYYDTNTEPERVYQAYLLGLLAIVGDNYIIKSNRESGNGRYDIMLVPHNKENFGIVIEIKQIQRKKEESESDFQSRINQKLEQARNQIEINEYYKELTENNITNILKIPIVFGSKIPYVFPIVNKDENDFE